MKNKMNKTSIWIMGIVIGLVAGGAAGYFIGINMHFYSNNHQGQNFPGFNMDNQTKAGIISFFNSTSDINAIKDYCNQNRMNCFYYCRSVDSSNAICPELNNFSPRQG